MKNFFTDLWRILFKYGKDEMTVYAAQASFFIIISAFPFMMLLMTLIQFIPDIGKSDILRILTSFIPSKVMPLVVVIIDELYTKSTGAILSVTAISALWTASKGVLAMETGLNKIYECPSERNYILNRIVCSFYTIIFMGICICSLILLVLGSSLKALIFRHFPFLSNEVLRLLSSTTLIAAVILTAAFICFYTFLPSKRQKLFYQIPGAIFSTIGWMLFSFLFSIYFEFFNNFSYMYGSLTAIVLFMLWLYFCICILFIGGEINYYYTKQFH